MLVRTKGGVKVEIIILGTNKQAKSIALANRHLAKSITIFDEDIESLKKCNEDFERLVGGDLNFHRKFKFTSTIFSPSTQRNIVFDCLEDNESKFEKLKLVNQEIKKVGVFFTTSKIHSISKIASIFDHPSAIVGLQYLHSFEITKAVELVMGIHTSMNVIEKAQMVMRELGKETILVKDTPGFLLNRMTIVMINEAINLLNEGISSPSEIDKEMELSLGMSQGPLRLADSIGLDVVLSMLISLYEGTGNPKFLPCSLLRNMVYSGYLGEKSNTGFYSYYGEILSFPNLTS